MNRLPFSAGRGWIRQGFDLFRKQPGTLATIFFAYLLMSMVAGSIPFAGAILQSLLVPMMLAALMQACVCIDRSQVARLSLVATGVRKPLRGRLLMLGLVYLGILVLSIGVATLIDGGVLLDAATGKLDPKAPETQPKVVGSMLLVSGISLPFTLSLSFTVPLILWQRMGLGKALFYSFFAALREWVAFAGFVVGWLLLGIALMAAFGLLALLFRQFALLLITPVTLTLWIVLNCSFYAAYRQVFGVPADAETQA